MSKDNRETNARSAVSLEIKNVRKAFAGEEVLKNVSFQVEAGEIFAIMGPSGSGKSVLLRTIMGLLQADSGNILIDGMDAANPETHKKRITSIVFQAGALFNSMSVYDNLALYPREHRKYSEKIIREKVMDTLQILSLEDDARKMPSELSGGMKKRVAIARALMMEPELILYDEPTSELDPVTSATIAEVIATLKKEFSVTTLVVTHDRELSLTISNRVARMLDGEILAVATPDRIRQHDHPWIQSFLNPSINLEKPSFRRNEPSISQP